MNDLEYLNQISVKPAPAPTSFFDKKTKLLAIIVGGVFFLAIILMMALSGNKSSEPTETSELYRVKYRATSINTIIQTYNSKVKSSDLRSTGASLSTLLAQLETTSNEYLAAYGVVDEKTAPALPAGDVEAIENATAALENATLNGILDRKYASELYYQVSHLLILEKTVYQMTKSSELGAFLSSSYDSLEKVGESLFSFSEAK